MLIYGLTDKKEFMFVNLSPEEEQLVLTIGAWYLVQNSQPAWNDKEKAHELDIKNLMYLIGGEA